MHNPDSARPDNRGVDGSIREYLSASAQQQLDALRATFDERVDALEQALLDPSRASSLVPLVLDLTRVATEEAEAVARQACLETQLQSQSAALAAVVADRSTIAELRKTLEKAKGEFDRLRAELEKERERSSASQRTVQDAGQRIAAAEARGSEAEARADEAEDRAEEAEERAEALEHERTEWLGAQTQLNAQLERAKAAMASSRATMEALQQQLADAKSAADAKAAELETTRRRLEIAVKEADARAAAAEDRASAAAAERDARTQDVLALRKATEEANGRLDAVRCEAESQAAQSSRAQEALAADCTRLKQTVSARETELAGERSSFAQERAKLEDALRESDARARDAVRDREDALTRLASLQQAMSAKEAEWAERLRGLDEQWLKLTVPAPVAPTPPRTSKPVETAAPTVTPVVVPPVPSTPPKAAAPEAPKVDGKPPVEAAKPRVEARPVVEAVKPKVERIAGLKVVPTVVKPRADVPPVEPEPLPASKLFEQEASESNEGVFSTVADALRAWTTEGVERPDKPGVAAGASQKTGPASAAAPDAPAAPASASTSPAFSVPPGLPTPPATAYDTVRQSPRHLLADCRLSIHVDGAPAELVDLSQGGAQVVTPSMLKPGRQVKLMFQLAGPAAVGKAKVVWSKLEPPSSGSGMLQYRAGLAFIQVDSKVIDKLLEKAAAFFKT